MVAAKTLSEIKTELRAVLISCPDQDGIKMNELNTEYRRIIGTNIPYYSFGFKNLKYLLESMPDVIQINYSNNFVYVKPIATLQNVHVQENVQKDRKKSMKRYNERNNNWYKVNTQNAEVYGASGNINNSLNQRYASDEVSPTSKSMNNIVCQPVSEDKEVICSERPKTHRRSQRFSIALNILPDLPSEAIAPSSTVITDNSDEIKSNIYTEKYSEYIITDNLQVGKIISFCVSEIFNPQIIYFNILDDLKYLRELTEDMNKYYSNLREKEHILSKQQLVISRPIAIFYGKDWHRAEILQKVDNDKMKIRLVDYGTIDIVAKAYFRLLKSEFGILPKQALSGRFSNIEVTSPERIPYVNLLFADAIGNNILEAEIELINLGEKIIHLVVKDVDRLFNDYLRNWLSVLHH